MSDYVYLVRNGDLYMIGRTSNLESKIKNLSPDEIIKTIEVDNSKTFQARLFRRYKAKRIPDTDYFRLNEEQLSDCINQLRPISSLPRTLSAEVGIGLTGSIILISFFSILFLYLGKGIFNSLAFSLLIGSLPMWIIFLLGNFGGYDINDLSLFSSWMNRLKAFAIAISITSLSYTFFHLNIPHQN